MKDMKYFDAAWNGPVKNQVILKAFDSERAKFTQPRLRKFPPLPHAGHPRQFLKSPIGRFDKTVGSVRIINGDDAINPNKNDKCLSLNDEALMTNQ